MATVVVIGASRGIGFEFARQYQIDGWNVVATVRDPAAGAALTGLGARVAVVDVTDEASVAALAASLADTAIDHLIVNAGIYGPRTSGYAGLDPKAWLDVMATNVVGAWRVAAALVDRVAASDTRRIAFISSRMGSMARNDSGGAYIYRSSKAALNAVVKSFAIDTAARGTTVLAFHPGWVRTDMGGPNADIDAATSVAGMRRVLAKAAVADSGRFFNYDGAAIDW
jgi:NAD(P)-dependent dehydrogenase (short-subunit alcohol dehydrogenase family)